MDTTEPLLESQDSNEDCDEVESRAIARKYRCLAVLRFIGVLVAFSGATWLIISKLVLSTLTENWEVSCSNLPEITSCKNHRALWVSNIVWTLWIVVVSPCAVLFATSTEAWQLHESVLTRIPVMEGRLAPGNAIAAVSLAVVIPLTGLNIIHFAYPNDHLALLLTCAAFSVTTLPIGVWIVSPRYIPHENSSRPALVKPVAYRLWISYLYGLWHTASVLTAWNFIANMAQVWLYVPHEHRYLAPLAVWVLPFTVALLRVVLNLHYSEWTAGACSVEGIYVVLDWSAAEKVPGALTRYADRLLLLLYGLCTVCATSVKVLVLMGFLGPLLRREGSFLQASEAWTRVLCVLVSLVLFGFHAIGIGTWMRYIPRSYILENRPRVDSDGGVLSGEDAPLSDSAEDQCGFVARYTFWWMWPVLKSANRIGSLSQHDLPKLPRRDKPRRLYANFMQSFAALVAKHPGRRPTAWALICRLCCGIQTPVFLYSFLHGWLFLFCMLLDPILLGRLLGSAQQQAAGLPEQLGLVLLLTLSMAVRVASMEVTYFGSVRVMSNARSALVHTLFCKALHLGGLPPPLAGGRETFDAGKLTNLLATDADSLGKSPWMIFFLAQWTWAVLSLPVVVYFMHRLVGNAAFVGAGMIILSGLVSRAIAFRMQPIQKRVQERRDDRSRHMKGLLSSIRMVKLECCEEVWQERVTEAREKELEELSTKMYLGTLNLLVSSVITLGIPVSIFAWYILVDGNVLDSRTAFTTLSWISQMSWSINTLPHMYNLWAYLSPSCDRIIALLMSGDERALDFDESFSHQTGVSSSLTQGFQSDGQGLMQGSSSAVVMEQALLGYGRDAIVLKNVNLNIQKGETVVIVGPVGSGKSTLLSSMANALPVLSGKYLVSSSRGFTEQKPFLMNDTVKENILFGLEYEERRYLDAISRTCLEQDLDSWDKRDLTAVGENGVQLSGGQQARVALARAMYADAQVYFFDDILSAVDATTGRTIWDRCVRELKRRGRTTVLVTHQVQYLEDATIDRVIVLARNSHDSEDHATSSIQSIDTWSNLKNSVDIAELVSEGDEEEEMEAADLIDERRAATSASEEEDETEEQFGLVTVNECDSFVRQLLMTYRGRKVTPELIQRLSKRMKGKDLEETKQQGVIAWEDFKVYLRAFGTPCILLLLAIVFLLGAAFNVAGNMWLAAWSDSNSEHVAGHWNSVVSDLSGDCGKQLPTQNLWNGLVQAASENNENASRSLSTTTSKLFELQDSGAVSLATTSELLEFQDTSAMPLATTSKLLEFQDTSAMPLATTSKLLEFQDTSAMPLETTSKLLEFQDTSAMPLAATSKLFELQDTGAVSLATKSELFELQENSGPAFALSHDCSKQTAIASNHVNGLYIYLAIGVAGALVVSLRSLIMILCSLRASRLIHKSLLAKILRLPLSFFDTNSVGLVLNRFLQDLQTLDMVLPGSMMDQVAATLGIITQLYVVVLFAPWVGLSLPVLAVPLAYIFSRVRSAARDSRRLESVSHSPVYGLFNDAVKGGATIRSFGAQERFKEKNLKLVARMAQGMYSSEAVVKWVQALSAQLGVLLYLVTGLTCVALSQLGLMTTGQMGLALLYSASLQRAFLDYMASLTVLETRFVSVERVAELTRLGSEEDLHAQEGHVPLHVPASWPPLGEIELRSVTVRYRLFRPSVLRNLSLRVAGGSKLAICGRSGCGKSTLFALLSRLYPLARGQVLVDGVDVSSVDLRTLRSAIRVVSQDAILISGTVRENLTMNFGGSSRLLPAIPDAEIWNTLRSVHLEDVVRQMPLGLDSQVSENGSNLSVGERSLLATARALLPRPGHGSPRIILCDEPTANIDLETDEKVHNVLLSPQATVVFICHRLQHIGKFDQVVVMGKGCVLEQGTPQELLANPKSELSSLWSQAGLR